MQPEEPPSQGQPQEPTANQEPPAPARRSWHSLWAVAQRWKVPAVVTFLFVASWWLYDHWPKIRVVDPQAVDTQNPHAWIFTIKNAGSLWATELKASCFIREMTYVTEQESDSWAYADAPTIDFGRIGIEEEFGLPCPQIFWVFQNQKDRKVFASLFSNDSRNDSHPPLPKQVNPKEFVVVQTRTALLDINLEYLALGLFRFKERARFIASRMPDGSLKWRRAGPNELLLKLPSDKIRFFLLRCADANKRDAYEYQISMSNAPKERPKGCDQKPNPQNPNHRSPIHQNGSSRSTQN